MMAEFLWFALAYAAIIRRCVLVRGQSRFLQLRHVLGRPANHCGHTACSWWRCSSYRHEEYQDAGQQSISQINSYAETDKYVLYIKKSSLSVVEGIFTALLSSKERAAFHVQWTQAGTKRRWGFHGGKPPIDKACGEGLMPGTLARFANLASMFEPRTAKASGRFAGAWRPRRVGPPAAGL